MAQVTYCEKCGAYIPEGQKKCLACGAFVGEVDGSNITEGFKIYVDGYELNERGEILSVPNEMFGTTIQNDTVLNFATALYDKAQQEQVDVDLDKLLKQEFFTVKIGGKVKWFYFGKADMEIGSTIYHTKDLFGHISINQSEKQKFHMVMIER